MQGTLSSVAASVFPGGIRGRGLSPRSAVQLRPSEAGLHRRKAAEPTGGGRGRRVGRSGRLKLGKAGGCGRGGLGLRFGSCRLLKDWGCRFRGRDRRSEAWRGWRLGNRGSRRFELVGRSCGCRLGTLRHRLGHRRIQGRFNPGPRGAREGEGARRAVARGSARMAAVALAAARLLLAVVGPCVFAAGTAALVADRPERIGRSRTSRPGEELVAHLGRHPHARHADILLCGRRAAQRGGEDYGQGPLRRSHHGNSFRAFARSMPAPSHPNKGGCMVECSHPANHHLQAVAEAGSPRIVQVPQELHRPATHRKASRPGSRGAISPYPVHRHRYRLHGRHNRCWHPGSWCTRHG